MFSSFFSTQAPVDPQAQNFFPIADRLQPNDLVSELQPADIEWLCAGGFVTETQTFYINANDGKSIMCQVIHSSVGVWYPTIQFTSKIFDSKTGQKIWKSINVTNFVTPPPGLDKRSSKADEFSLTLKPNPNNLEYPESYVIRANLGMDLQISLEFKRPATVPGFKVGKGPKGGYSYFGTDLENPEGYVVHRFWPRAHAEGALIINGKVDSVEGPAMFVHAIQGMRPNLVAAAWNFASFQSNDLGGVSAIQMEFTTTDQYGKRGAGSGGVSVNVGSIVVGNKLVAVTAETKYPGEKGGESSVISKATHLKPEQDPDTGYNKPSEIAFEWKGPSILTDAPGEVSAVQITNLGIVEAPNGLIEKVDVLAEIPRVLKLAVNYVAGTKPYIYQWINPGTMKITGPDGISAGLSGGLTVEGTMYNEATFIS